MQKWALLMENYLTDVNFSAQLWIVFTVEQDNNQDEKYTDNNYISEGPDLLDIDDIEIIDNMDLKKPESVNYQDIVGFLN